VIPVSEDSSGETEGAGRGAAAFARAYDALGHIGGFVLAVMTAAVFLQVVLRFAGSSSIDGLDEVPRFLFVWLVMIGAAAAMHRHQHTVLDYFVNRLGPRPRALTQIVVNAVGIVLFLVLIKLSFVLVPNAQLQTSAGLNLSLGWVFVAVPVGAVLIILPMAVQIFAALRILWPRPS
jgi:TRAP-type C4-dicarboxylate transport system permease small subunit